MKKRSSEKRKISFREKSTRRGIARREEIFYEDASVRGYDDLWQADIVEMLLYSLQQRSSLHTHHHQVEQRVDRTTRAKMEAS